ncbi:MAG: hypothetical protein A3F53_00975 [Candidatus Zambryskibacteria bacterium RIFCSPHIGHO2_12_FULL_48_10]|uniref:Uncharacterized protein n=1 Tax=Candidatus Zambryskibacteria bacterium RIFCSPHIGHO2_01_FULL_46_25 TaxID=1802738 RepID=A0A1G2SYH6_9BACT|nr:MAG: hypothetical protein UX71_C0002G0194 [Parcubacteria group bacterium GW2011_GWA1_47_10]OHA90090.1 MAG: hypothetical protein A2838_00460 [Candidatus Zambryskibacteria bacterium RIFCSPHIGHO2_01_FULL_46_25]OHB00858.1 MAG: hypothetical protein A3F53_00975 [Candidatus Zambryskibacteria bacterium RIFCSPHIGHO2_12_FULL_48_10]OHB06535.1 MAG: hypothetical protein A3A31_02795 [Candidatus Zambryskibacteria bacterium RIFCSPLOWO2_01_FULL_48_25]
MTKKILAYVLVIVILAVAGFAAYRVFNKPDELSSEKAVKLNLAEISFEGQVISIAGGVVTARAGRVQRTDEGNALVMYDREIIFSGTEGKNIFDNLKVGDKAVFYGKGDINSATDNSKFTAYKVVKIK